MAHIRLIKKIIKKICFYCNLLYLCNVFRENKHLKIKVMSRILDIEMAALVAVLLWDDAEEKLCEVG